MNIFVHMFCDTSWYMFCAPVVCVVSPLCSTSVSTGEFVDLMASAGATLQTQNPHKNSFVTFTIALTA